MNFSNLTTDVLDVEIINRLGEGVNFSLVEVSPNTFLFDKNGSKVKLYNVDNTQFKVFIDSESVMTGKGAQTELVYFPRLKFKEAEIKLKQIGPRVNKVLKCEYFDLGEFLCDKWLLTNLTFMHDGGDVVFNITEAGIYAGGFLGDVFSSNIETRGFNYSNKKLLNKETSVKEVISNGSFVRKILVEKLYAYSPYPLIYSDNGEKDVDRFVTRINRSDYNLAKFLDNYEMYFSDYTEEGILQIEFNNSYLKIMLENQRRSVPYFDLIKKRVVYPNLLNGMDLGYRINGNSFKQEILLNGRLQDDIRFLLALRNVNFVKKGLKYVFYNNITDEELQQKLEAYSHLAKTGEPLDKEQIKRNIGSLLDRYDVKGRVKRKEGTALGGIEAIGSGAAAGSSIGGPAGFVGGGPVGGIVGAVGGGITGGIAGAFGGRGGGDTINEAVAGYRPAIEDVLAEFIAHNRRLPDVGELRDFANSKGLPGQDFISDAAMSNFLKDQDVANIVASNYGAAPKDYSLDVKRIQDVLATRGVETRKTAVAEKTLADLPMELGESRGRYLTGLEESASEYVRSRFAPRAISQLNVRGLAEGPDVASVIATERGRIQGVIESNLRSQAEQDAAFFTEAAFNIQTAKLNMAEDAFRSQAEFERVSARQKQESAFRSREKGIMSEFEIDMLAREQERGLRLQQAGINLETSTTRSGQVASDIGTVGMSIGELVGTKLSEPKKTKTLEDGSTKGAPALKEGSMFG